MFLRIFAIVAAVALAARASAATFLDRLDPRHLRVATWNIYFDSIFPGEDLARVAQFNRVVAAVDADVWAFQEIYEHNGAAVKARLDEARPLGTAQGWYVYKASSTLENTIASRYPLTLTASNTTPAGYRPVAMALVDLPDATYATDLYMMNAHWRCCGGNDPDRQRQSDAFVNWMRNAREPSGLFSLPLGTPMVLAGDFNLVDGQQPLTTVLDGNIINENVYGPDSPPDWDGTANMFVDARHNQTETATYTWRNDNGGFAPGRLDYITYTDSVMTVAKSFILSTRTMTAADRAATGLQLNDSVLTASNWDHLPVVADFILPTLAPLLAADFDSDHDVDTSDLALWTIGFGMETEAARINGDANADGSVDGADLIVWQQQLSAPALAPSSLPLPEPASAVLLFGALAARCLRGPIAGHRNA